MDKIYMKYVANLFDLELNEPFTLLSLEGDECKKRVHFHRKRA